MADAAAARRPPTKETIWEDVDFLAALWTGDVRPEPEQASALRHRVLRALSRAAGLEVEANLIR